MSPPVLVDGMTIAVDGELTPYGQDLAEERHHHTWPDEDDHLMMDLEPYPDSSVD